MAQCLQLTSTELANLISEGWAKLTGPHTTQEQCLAVCGCNVYGNYDLTWDDTEQAWLSDANGIVIRLWCDGDTFQISVDCPSSSSSSKSSGSSVTLECCPGVSLPTTLNGLISAPFGDAIACFPTSDITLNYIGGGIWETDDLGCTCLPDGRLQFSCNSETGFFELNVAYSLNSQTCSPYFEVVFGSATCIGVGGFELTVTDF